MSKTNPNISDKIDHLFRHEYGKIVSVLTKVFGISNIELAEDVVQEAMLEALDKWTSDGVPDTKGTWEITEKGILITYHGVGDLNRILVLSETSLRVISTIMVLRGTTTEMDVVLTRVVE